MAQNDMYVIFYKVLAYLYKALKDGKNPSWADLQFNSTIIDIPYAYWMHIMQELIDEGYIKGVNAVQTKSGFIFCDNGIYITAKGVEFLETNGLMGKAKDFLGESFQTVLNALVSGLTQAAVGNAH